MEKIDIDVKELITKIKNQTGENPDIIIKEMNLKNTDIAIIFSNSLSDRTTINDYILEFLENLKMNEQNIFDLYDYIYQYITMHKVTKINNYNDLFYNLLSGFTLIAINGKEEIISIETKAVLDSGVIESKNETVTKGPKDGFSENYQTNIGLIRKRIKTKELWLEEHVIGSISKTKVGILYIKDIASNKLVDTINEKIKNININAVMDSNYIIESISENIRNVFPNYLSTERPDLTSIHLLEGRIAIVVENTPYVIIIPAMFVNFFQSPEDYYQKSVNVNLTRIIRMIAFIITLLTPAIYVAISTYNIEAIPTKLLLSLATQRDGVPLPTVLEILMMIITFEILKETDTRAPSAIGSSLSIVGALVLGQAAVAAGIVSPITIIVVAITAISGLIAYAVDIVQGVRWWRLVFLLFASLAGLLGVLIAGFIFIINVSSIKSFGVPYLAPFAPFFKDEQSDALYLTNKRKLNKRSQLISKKNTERQAKKNEAS